MDKHQDSALDDAIKTTATRYDAPPELRAQITRALQSATVPPATSPRAASWPAWRQWLNPGLAFACGLLVSVAVIRLFPVGDEQDHLAQDLVAGHVRSLMVAHLADVASSDQHTVKPWFTGKLDFSPPVHDLAKEGFALVGGRLDYIEQRSVAALVYQHRQHTINLFVWPSGSDGSSGNKPAPRQGFNLTNWKEAGLQFWAVSDVSPQELETFSALLRQQSTRFKQL